MKNNVILDPRREHFAPVYEKPKILKHNRGHSGPSFAYPDAPFDLAEVPMSKLHTYPEKGVEVPSATTGDYQDSIALSHQIEREILKKIFVVDKSSVPIRRRYANLSRLAERTMKSSKQSADHSHGISMARRQRLCNILGYDPVNPDTPRPPKPRGRKTLNAYNPCIFKNAWYFTAYGQLMKCLSISDDGSKVRFETAEKGSVHEYDYTGLSARLPSGLFVLRYPQEVLADRSRYLRSLEKDQG